MILLASGIAMKKNMHVGVDILLRKLNLQTQKIIISISTIIIMIFLIMVLKGTVQLLVVGAQSTSPAISIPMWIPYLSVPIGVSYIMLELMILTFTKLKQKN
jgi:C4-dicarboxylate transporter DctQ subunit